MPAVAVAVVSVEEKVVELPLCERLAMGIVRRVTCLEDPCGCEGATNERSVDRFKTR